ncbi:MAG TPA: DNA cytosine methyltransferase [Pseudonocardiaceae bacterium]|nr:DNA cytosine methyltransferase [Pseudonocardiaceae bacterium]
MIGSLCTGYGGLDDAVHRVLGDELAWWSDVDPGPVTVMEHHAPGVPNLGDLKTVNWLRVPRPRIVTAGYPCQPFSNAGLRKGTDDPRHLWPWISDALGVLRPDIIVLENVAAHLRRGWDVVSADLTGLGYDVAWRVVRASEVGAPHRRARLFAVAVAQDSDRAARGQRWEPAPGQEEVGWTRPDPGRRGGTPAAYAESQRRHERWSEYAGQQGWFDVTRDRRAVWGQYANAIARWESVLGRVAPEPTQPGRGPSRVLSPRFVEWMMGLDDGYVTGVRGLSRNQQLRLLGNGVVPQQAEYAITSLLRDMFQLAVML